MEPSERSIIVRETSCLGRDTPAFLASCQRNGVTAECIGNVVRGKRKISDFFVFRLTAETTLQIVKACKWQ